MAKLKSLLDLGGIDNPMDMETSSIFFTLSGCMPEYEKQLEEDTKSDPGVRIITARLDKYNIPYNYKVVLMCSTLANGIPGRMVSWAYAIADYHKQNNKIFAWEDFVSKFPTGFPTDAHYDEVWDAQKHPTEEIDNGYDYPEYW